MTAFVGGPAVSWEPDVFGGLRRSAEEAQANYQASEESRRGVWLTVLGDVAQAYFQLLSLDVQRETTLRTIAARQETLDLYRTQLQGGVGTGLQVARAEADVYGAQATLADIERQIATSEDSISLLLGLAPAPVARPAAVSALPPPPDVPAGLPSALLERRPDVRQAEQQLVAANAEVGVRTANLFPTFPLTGNAGLLSAALGAIVSEKGWAYLLLGAMNWTAPILQGRRLARRAWRCAGVEDRRARHLRADRDRRRPRGRGRTRLAVASARRTRARRAAGHVASGARSTSPCRSSTGGPRRISTW